MQDGSIQYEVKLTGCLSTSVMSEGEGMDPTHGTLIGPHLNAQLHQHYFCVRLDMAVDDPDGGAALTVSEVSHPYCTYQFSASDQAASCLMEASCDQGSWRWRFEFHACSLCAGLCLCKPGCLTCTVAIMHRM